MAAILVIAITWQQTIHKQIDHNFSVIEAQECLSRFNGDILFLGNSISRGLFSFLNTFVNEWPLLTRQQQKELCQRDNVSLSYNKDCDFSRFDQKIPLYFDQYQSYCGDDKLKQTLNQSRWKHIVVMVGHYDLSHRFRSSSSDTDTSLLIEQDAWHGRDCIPELFRHTHASITHMTPTNVCMDPWWGTTHDYFLSNMTMVMDQYITPTFRSLTKNNNVTSIDFTRLTSDNHTFLCTNVDPNDPVHPISWYPKMINVWLNHICPHSVWDNTSTNNLILNVIYGRTTSGAEPSLESIMP